MKRIKFLFAALALFSGVMACTKAEETTTPQSLLPQVTLTIVPDYTDGTVKNYNPKNNLMYLSVEVTPAKYAEALSDTSKFIHKAVFSPVQTKGGFGEAFTITPRDISYNAGAPIPFLDLCFEIDAMSAFRLDNGTYAVSCTIEDKEGVNGVSTAFVPISYENGSGGGDGQTDNAVPAGALPGKFTVNAEGKQVFFSKGNLWYGKLNGEDAATFHLESNQYESTPSSTSKDRDTTHISHFMWCNTAEKAMALKYNSIWNGEGPFFAEKAFTVNGVNTWFTLTGGDKGEWKFLIDRKDSEGNALYNLGVKVCGSANCLILLPDDWKWGENGVGTDWLSEYSESTTVKWSTMENAGAVCLPAAGLRNGNPGRPNPAVVSNVGNRGYYWSASPNNDNIAYDLYFHSGNVYPSDKYDRNQAYSVRLVTESK